MRKFVDVGNRNEVYIVTSFTQVPAGFWVMNGFLGHVPAMADAGTLGRVIQDALDVSNQVPFNDEDVAKSTFTSVLKLAKVRSLRQYMKGAVRLAFMFRRRASSLLSQNGMVG